MVYWTVYSGWKKKFEFVSIINTTAELIKINLIFINPLLYISR